MVLLLLYVDDNDWDDYGDNGYWAGGGGGGPGPMNRMKPGRGGGYNDDDNYMDGPRHLVHMRGLPYRAIEDDIALVIIVESLRSCCGVDFIPMKQSFDCYYCIRFIVFQTIGSRGH